LAEILGMGEMPASGSPRRVILVGRTGLDARLRLDPMLELVRTGTALEAIGELAGGVGGDVTTILLAPDADAAFVGANAEREVREFLRVVREAEPKARVLLAGRGTEVAWSGLLDGTIARDASPEAIRSALHDVPTVASAAMNPEPNGRAAPAAAVETIPVGRTIGLDEERPGTDRKSIWADTGDEALARLLLLGKDPVPTALGLIRSRLGLGASVGVAFRPESDGPGATVMWRGRTLGRLEITGVGSDRVAPHASWLGAWVALRDQHQQLRQAAFTDPLTGAYNRRFFDFFLRSTMEEAKAHRRSLTLMLFDIDDFKQYNDRHGHAAGDEILLQTMRLLKSVIRPMDKVCRVGGDEFAVIFYDPSGPRTANSSHPTDVRQIAQRFQREIHSQKFPKLGDQAPGLLTISAGLATYPWDGRTPEELLQTADDLALRAKRQGKNTITFGPGLSGVEDAGVQGSGGPPA
jgi:diguanylate cyclase (GGDEF)-like protein